MVGWVASSRRLESIAPRFGNRLPSWAEFVRCALQLGRNAPWPFRENCYMIDSIVMLILIYVPHWGVLIMIRLLYDSDHDSNAYSMDDFDRAVVVVVVVVVVAIGTKPDATPRGLIRWTHHQLETIHQKKLMPKPSIPSNHVCSKLQKQFFGGFCGDIMFSLRLQSPKRIGRFEAETRIFLAVGMVCKISSQEYFSRGCPFGRDLTSTVKPWMSTINIGWSAVS